MNARLAALACCLFLVTGCDTARPAPMDLVAEGQSAITNGLPDNVHNAVVSLAWDTGACTATLIDVRDTRGFALTAGHCCIDATMKNPMLFGGENATIRVDSQIRSMIVDRAYDGRAHDFCIVEFEGEPKVLQSFPTAAWSKDSDELVAGDMVDFVGYGFDGTIIGQRQHVEVPLSRVAEGIVEYDQTHGGPCSGDSGGPGFVTNNGEEILALVISHGPDHCDGTGVSGRVSTVADDFIETTLADEPQRITCNACAKAAASRVGLCASVRASCNADTSCHALATCYASCKTSACMDECARAYPQGQEKYDAILSCACDDACSDVCQDDDLCTAPPAMTENAIIISGGACSTFGTGPSQTGVAWLMAFVALARRFVAKSQRDERGASHKRLG